MNVLIVQQLAWGLRIGHGLARIMYRRGHRLSAMVHGVQTHASVMRQREVPYEHVWLADPIYDASPDAGSLDVVREIEQRYQLDSAWRLIVADRILTLSFQSSRHFRYRRARSNDELLAALAEAYRAVRRVVEQVEPDCVVAPNIVALPSYLLYLECRHRKIPFLSIGYSRFGRQFFIGDDERMGSGRVLERFLELREDPDRSPRAAEGRALYERMLDNDDSVRPSYLPERRVDRTRRGRLLVSTATLPLRLARAALLSRPVLGIRRIWLPNNSRMNAAWAVWTTYREQFWRTDHQGACLRDLAEVGFDYIFYPLQLEPEMTLMAWAPEFANQIEVCRRVAMALPGGVRLLVKEHPNMVSSRRSGYYDKLRGLPNVELIHGSVPAPRIFRHPRCRAVVAINSTVGFEAAMSRTPVVLLGRAQFDVLPWVRRAGSYEEAVERLRELCLDGPPLATEEMERANVAYLVALLEEGIEADYVEVWAGLQGDVPLEAFVDAIENRARGAVP